MLLLYRLARGPRAWSARVMLNAVYTLLLRWARNLTSLAPLSTASAIRPTAVTTAPSLPWATVASPLGGGLRCSLRGLFAVGVTVLARSVYRPADRPTATMGPATLGTELVGG